MQIVSRKQVTSQKKIKELSSLCNYLTSSNWNKFSSDSVKCYNTHSFLFVNFHLHPSDIALGDASFCYLGYKPISERREFSVTFTKRCKLRSETVEKYAFLSSGYTKSLRLCFYTSVNVVM
jgi:hypothetical protein